MGAWTTGPGGPLAFSAASGGKIHAYNDISTVLKTVIAANTSRQQLTFHNPGPIDIFIAPVIAINYATGLNETLTPSLASLGGCFRIFGNGGSLTLTGEIQGAWQAFAASGATNPFTVMDSNI